MKQAQQSRESSPAATAAAASSAVQVQPTADSGTPSLLAAESSRHSFLSGTGGRSFSIVTGALGPEGLVPTCRGGPPPPLRPAAAAERGP